MKKLGILIAALFFLAMQGCRKENEIFIKELDPQKDAAIIAGIEQSPHQGIPFPEGTRAIAGKDGSVRLLLPDGYHYIVQKKGSKDPEILRSDETLSVTCTCTKGSDCTPLRYKGKYYCVMGGGCSSCDKATTLDDFEVEVVGVFNENADITLLVNKQVDGLAAIGTSTLEEIIGSANTALFKSPTVKSGLMKFYDFIYEGAIPQFIQNNEIQLPNGYRMVAVSIYGNLAAIPIPESMLKDNYITVDDGGKTTCQCLDANPSGCEKNSILGAVFCEAKTCKSCSLID